MLLHAEGAAIIADTGYDSDSIAKCARSYNMKPVIHPHPCRKKRRRLDRRLYGIRYRVECFFHDLKRFRSAATRYDKTATCFLAILHVVSILLWLK
jgi:transposase